MRCSVQSGGDRHSPSCLRLFVSAATSPWRWKNSSPKRPFASCHGKLLLLLGQCRARDQSQGATFRQLGMCCDVCFTTCLRQDFRDELLHEIKSLLDVQKADVCEFIKARLACAICLDVVRSLPLPETHCCTIPLDGTWATKAVSPASRMASHVQCLRLSCISPHSRCRMRKSTSGHQQLLPSGPRCRVRGLVRARVPQCSGSNNSSKNMSFMGHQGFLVFQKWELQRGLQLLCLCKAARQWLCALCISKTKLSSGLLQIVCCHDGWGAEPFLRHCIIEEYLAMD